MKVSLNWLKKYVDLPKDVDINDIAYNLTLRTVEVENVENTRDKFHDIIVGKIEKVMNHPNADKLKVCMVDIGEEKPRQIVCGGTNLYEGEYVVVSKPGSEVYWHGESELVEIKETKMRGVDSYGMICGAEEVFLEEFFPESVDTTIVDLDGVDCKVGQNIADVIDMNDYVLEIDNKSLTNRPDLWGHYGIARELSVIYNCKLKELDSFEVDKLPEYKVEIKEPDKCRRYCAVEIDGVYDKKSPMWMQSALVKAGMRPISAIVDITNYSMLATGQPMHAFDKTHVEGEKIVVRNAKKNEKLLLLDDKELDLYEDDLVICDTKKPMCLAGIKGGKDDSILPETTGVVLEVANFSASTIRNTSKRFDEKTDSSIRYEKNIDTERNIDGVRMALYLFKELFEDVKFVKYADVYPTKTERSKIEVSKDFLDRRLGKVIDNKTITSILEALGYDVSFDKKVYKVVAPIWRSTGDVSIKDDVMGDIARILTFDSFEAKPLNISFEHSVIQPKVLLERRIKEYLAIRCGFNEIYTYPWIEDKYLNACGVDTKNCIKLATPPAPELSTLRNSLVPGMVEAISKNLRYYTDFKLFEVAQVFEKGKYSPSVETEVLPVHRKLVTGCIVNKDAKEVFYEIKGVIENMCSYIQAEEITFSQGEKPSWADINAYLDIKYNDEVIGKLGLVSYKTMSEAKIKRCNVGMFELDIDKLVPYESRTNKFEHLEELPLLVKDLSLVMDESVRWEDIYNAIKKKVKDVIFIEEYRGDQIPEGMKSIVLRITMVNEGTTMTSEEINKKVNSIVRSLEHQCGVKLREE